VYRRRLGGVPVAIAVLALLVGALAIGPPAAVPRAGASSGGACRPAGARTITSDSRVRVYSLAGRGPFVRVAYACLFGRGRTVALGARGVPQVRVGPVALAGTLLVFASSTMGIDTSSASVEELDLSAGQPRLSSWAAATPPTRPESFSSVTDLRITGRGSVAWIARLSGITQPVPVFEVHTRLRPRAASLLASGPAVMPESLRLAGGRVSWLNAGQSQSAALP
jgi:hypothetical protein